MYFANRLVYSVILISGLAMLICLWKVTAVPWGLELNQSRTTAQSQFGMAPQIVLLSPQNPAQWNILRKVTIKNPSPSKLMHVDLSGKSCSCTSVAGVPCDIPPGESREIEILMELTYREDLRAADVTFSTTDPARPIVQEHFKFLVIPRLMVEASGQFQKLVRRGITATQRIVVTSVRQAADKVGELAVSTNMGQLKIESEQTSIEGELVRQTQIVVLSLPVPEDHLIKSLPVEITAKTANEKYSTKFEFVIDESIKVEPERLLLRGDDSASGTITLTSDQKFQVKTIEHPELTTVPTNNGDQWTVHVTVPRIKQERFSKHEIQLETDHPHAKKLKIPVFVIWQSPNTSE